MTDPAALLAGALPADPNDHGPIAVPSDTVRGVLAARDETWDEQRANGPSPSATAAHARIELQRLGEDPDVIDWYCRVIDEFMSYGHSGGSASVCIPTLTALLQHEALGPLTNDPAEWIDQAESSGYPLWQNRRDSRAFSEDGGKTYWWVHEKEAAGSLDTTSVHQSDPAEPIPDGDA